MVDWFTTKIASTTEGLPHEHAIAPHLGPQRRRRLLRMLRGGHPPGRAGRVQPADRLRPRPPGRAAVATAGSRNASGRGPRPGPGRPRLDEPTRRRLAVTAFAMGISTRQIEDLLRVLLADDGPDHSTIARWVADEAEKARPVLEALDAACVPRVQTLAVDEIFFGGGRPWSGSSRRA